MANEITPGIDSFCFNRIYILLSSSIPMTFYDFFHDLFKFSMTLRLAVTFKKLFVALEYFWLLTVQRIQTLVSTKMRAVRTV